MGPWSCLAEEWFGIPVPMQVGRSSLLVRSRIPMMVLPVVVVFCFALVTGCSHLFRLELLGFGSVSRQCGVVFLSM